jgi:hypothetical protein
MRRKCGVFQNIPRSGYCLDEQFFCKFVCNSTALSNLQLECFLPGYWNIFRFDNMTAIEMPSAAPYDHWLKLSPSDWRKVFKYIPMLEAAQGELESEEASPIALDDLKWGLYVDLAFLGLVYDLMVDPKMMSEMCGVTAMNEFDYLTLCELLAVATHGDNFSNGVLELKIKDKTILRILKALQNRLSS